MTKERMAKLSAQTRAGGGYADPDGSVRKRSAAATKKTGGRRRRCGTTRAYAVNS